MPKFTKNQWIAIAAITVPAILGLIYFIFSKPSFTQSGKINTVGQSGGTNLVINDEATYSWANEKNWTPDGKQVNLLFIANGPVIPVSPCLYIDSDAKVQSAGPVGYSVHWQKINPPKNYVGCFSGLNNTVTFQVFFDKTPTRIKAGLLQDDTGINNNKTEPHFTIPVIQ